MESRLSYLTRMVDNTTRPLGNNKVFKLGTECVYLVR
jgi:hypothetical protein